MASPEVQKIGRGVDAIDRAKAQLPNARLAKIASAPTTPPEIQAFAAAFKQRRDRIRAIHVADNEHLEQRKLDISREVAGLGLSKTEQVKLIDKANIHARKLRAAETAEERGKLADANRTDADVLNTVKSQWHTPEAVLLSATLGSRARADYAANLKDASIHELNNSMTRAISTQDRELAAACCSRLDTLNREQRQLAQFTKTELCETLVPEYAVVQEAFALSDLFHQQTILTALEIQGKRISPEQKVKIGVVLLELEKRGIADPDKSDTPKNENLEQKLDRLYPGKKDADSGYETVAYGDPKRQAEFEAKGGASNATGLRARDKVYWEAEAQEKGTGDAAVEAFKAGGS